MDRLAEFRPHLTGAVWRGTATRLNSVHLQLFCDDSKAAEIELLNQKISSVNPWMCSPWPGRAPRWANPSPCIYPSWTMTTCAAGSSQMPTVKPSAAMLWRCAA
jgi:hypothetical protein